MYGWSICGGGIANGLTVADGDVVVGVFGACGEDVG